MSWRQRRDQRCCHYTYAITSTPAESDKLQISGGEMQKAALNGVRGDRALG
jgi:hypothetical protein